MNLFHFGTIGQTEKSFLCKIMLVYTTQLHKIVIVFNLSEFVVKTITI